MEVAFVDAGYTGKPAAKAAEGEGIRLEIIPLPDVKNGFVLLSRRWVVERSFRWVTWVRRRVRYDERLPHCRLCALRVAWRVVVRLGAGFIFEIYPNINQLTFFLKKL
jgi:transposase